MKYLLVASVILLSALNAQAGQKGFDAIGSIATTTFQCLKNAGYSYFMGRVYHSYGAVDTQGIQNIKNARAAGLTDVGGYLFPCLAANCGSGASQVQAVHDALQQQSAQINTLWLDIETYHWPTNTATNQAFIQDMVTRAKSLNMDVGIYTSAPSWGPIVGESYHGQSSLKLWWPRYDGRQDFSNFKPFGGWSSALIHQYAGDVNGGCGVSMDQNYRS